VFIQGHRLALWRGFALLAALTQVGAASSDEVLRAGTQSLTVAALEQRLAALTPLGLQPFGTDRATRLRGYLDQMVVPELILDQAAANDEGLRKSALMQAQRDALLSQAVEQQLGTQVQLDDAQIQKYFDAHRARFERPATLLLWRILVDSAERARDIIKQCQGAKGVTRWRELSREHSLDKATNLRDGLLGFVRADGTTDVPQLQVEPALYAAASKVAEGEIVGEPIAEGNRFAVVWRRGSRPASSVSLVQATPTIRAALWRDKTHEAVTGLLDGLRRDQLKELHPELIELIDYPLPTFTPRDAFPAPQASESAAPSRPPKPTERGLR
jgi:peptidyl-prolyl cis-trans isomerase C